jgi:outer membrane protein OmpA-like peptidoglycan-associated protein
MSESLIDLAKTYLTPDVIAKIAGHLGETPAATKTAAASAVPSVLAGALNQVSTPEGASSLAGILGKLDPNILGNFAGMLGGGGTTDGLLKAGEGLLAGLFGSNSGGIGNLISSLSGIRSSSASSLLGMITPLVMGLLGKRASTGTQGPSAASLTNLLAGQKDEIARSAPAGLAKTLGLDSLASLGRPVAQAAEEGASAARGLLPWVLAAVALVILFLLYRGCSSTPPTAAIKQALSTISLPGGGTLSVAEGGFHWNLATFLEKGTDAELPKRFVFENLNFETGGATLTPESLPTITNLVAILKAYPKAEVQLEGHTDSTGDAEANKKLSLDRANLVKDKLVAGGVEASRISTAGWGAEKPIAPNDTEEGRAKNRRTELVVLKK